MAQKTVTLVDIYEAEKRLQGQVRATPLLRNQPLEAVLGCEVYLKPEMLQITGSFKIRGATNKILSLSEADKKRGIICSSSGNHGQACALVGKVNGIEVVIVLPQDAPEIKIKAAEKLGAKVILGPRRYDERMALVNKEIELHGYTMVHGYEDYRVMAGQGTIGLEILRDLSEINTIVVPVGGGGLIAGICVAVKETKPNIKVIGVQAKASAAYVESLKKGYPVEVACTPTIADGLTCRQPGHNPYPIIEKYVDEVVSVEEADIKEAMKLLAVHGKLIAEPSSCVGIAAVLGKEIQVKPDEKVCFILTSGNWDIEKISKIYCGEAVEGVI